MIDFGENITDMREEEAKEFIGFIDMNTSCTSKWIRGQIEGNNIAQFGNGIPIFAITQRSKNCFWKEQRM